MGGMAFGVYDGLDAIGDSNAMSIIHKIVGVNSDQ